MNKEKQIDNMMQDICKLGISCNDCNARGECVAKKYAIRFYTAGYRKASDVTREIFEEIGELANEYLDGRIYTHDFCTYLAELKKKYTESEKDNG